MSLDVDVAALLPGDDIDEQGFDNMADVLTVSPVLLDAICLRPARWLAWRWATAARPGDGELKMPLLLVQDDRMSDDLPFGSRGGLAFRHQFPVDGEYEVQFGCSGTT